MPIESHFVVPRMDCPSEEGIIRMALESEPGILGLRFDLGDRRLVVWHDPPAEAVLDRLEPLGLGARLEHSHEATMVPEDAAEDHSAQSRALRLLLAINGTMFVVELSMGFAAASTGLIADSLDMLADAMVYGLSLYAVGRGVGAQKRAARASGRLQLALALGVIAEVLRRALMGSEPVEALMISVATIALAANVACLALLARHREGGAHLRASWIFSTNDVLANLGVILAGALVWATGSAIPDLVIGSIVGVVVLIGGVRILRLAR